MNLNGEFPLTSEGDYIGNETYPDFRADLKTIKRGKVKRVTLSIGSSNYGDWENIKALVDSQGTGPDSILYQDFAALKAALPLDAIDFDEENGYDESSTIKFAVMLGRLGYKVTMDPYTDSGFWTDVVSKINKKRAGTVDAIHLQTYAGGEGNSPCSGRGGLEFRQRAGLSRRIGPTLGAARSDAGGGKDGDEELAYAMRHHRRLAVDFRSDRGHQPGAEIRPRDHQRRRRSGTVVALRTGDF